jgi:uncharacterized protein YfbU (UPF0304 family)
MDTPKLSPTERLILANQYKILAQTEAEGMDTSTYENKAEILLRGYTGLYHMVFDSLSEEEPESVTDEVHDILSMFQTIEGATSSLSDEQKQQLNMSKLTFSGFDGNNDDHYHQTRFMINNLDYYEGLGYDINSHTSSSLPRYRRQLAVFKTLTGELSISDLNQIAAA